MPLIAQTLWGALLFHSRGIFLQRSSAVHAFDVGIGVFTTYFSCGNCAATAVCGLRGAHGGMHSDIFRVVAHVHDGRSLRGAHDHCVGFFRPESENGFGTAWFFGACFALAATLTRQLALCVPLAFAVALLLKNGLTRRNVMRARIPRSFASALFSFFSNGSRQRQDSGELFTINDSFFTPRDSGTIFISRETPA